VVVGLMVFNLFRPVLRWNRWREEPLGSREDIPLGNCEIGGCLCSTTGMFPPRRPLP